MTMTVLTPAQAIAADTQIEAPITGIVAVGRRMLTASHDPRFIADWITVEVELNPDLATLATGQECPACYAIHDEAAWSREGMDDGWCSQACQDDAASAMDEARTRAGWAA